MDDWLRCAARAGRAGDGRHRRRLGAARAGREDAGARRQLSPAPSAAATSNCAPSRSRAPCWATGAARHFERFALGPSLGQCCGGVVHLAFELVDAAQAALLRERAARGQLAPGGASTARPTRRCSTRRACSWPARLRPLFARGRGTHVMQDEDGRRWLVDAVLAPRAHLVLFGAGHVGAAIVRALADLPCTVTWVDEREDMFPPTVPANVTVEATDTPRRWSTAAPAGASYLVMTHSHALDQRLAEAITGAARRRAGSA